MRKATLTGVQTNQSTTRSNAVRMASNASPGTWDDAISDYLLLVQGTREEKTVRFYRQRLAVLSSWAKKQALPLHEFRARNLRQYLAARSEQGVSDMTRRHDAVAAKSFLKFCAQEEYITSNPLSGYQVPKADRAYIKCPSDDEIRTLLTKIQERWNPVVNPDARFVHATARRFFMRRNYAIVTGLIETGAARGVDATNCDVTPSYCDLPIYVARGGQLRTKRPRPRIA